MEREVYPNAPLVLVAAEFRHTAAEALSNASQAAIKRVLKDRLPLSKPLHLTNISGTVGAPPQVKNLRTPRFMSRDRTHSATFREDAIVVEATSYSRFEAFMEFALRVVQARQDVSPVNGLERVGLRYIDEVRVPELGDDLSSWQEWVHPSLLGPAGLGSAVGLLPGFWQGLSTFKYGDQSSRHDVTLRYGPREGYALDPGGDLRRPTPAPGPYFLIDIDSFWTPDQDIPPFATTQVESLLPELHAPIRGIFEASITSQLREKVLRNGD